MNDIRTEASSVSWGDFVSYLRTPTVGEKGSGGYLLPGGVGPTRTLDENVEPSSLLWLDIDDGNLSRSEVLKLMPESNAWVIYTTASSTPARRKWRAFIPLETPLDMDDWTAASVGLMVRLADEKDVDLDAVAGRRVQPIFVPTILEAGHEYLFAENDGPPIPGSTVVHWIRDGRERGAQAKRVDPSHNLAVPCDDDPLLEHLERLGMRGDKIDIVCPFESEHTSETAQSATSYVPGKWLSCQHSHATSGRPYLRQPNQEHDPTRRSVLDDLGIFEAYWDAFTLSLLDVRRGDVQGYHSEIEQSVAEHTLELEQSVDVLPPASGRNGAGLVILSVAEIAFSRVSNYLIRGVCTRGSFTLLYGDRGSGKSFLALELAAAVASGRDFLGEYKARQGAAFYVAAEGGYGLSKRIEGLKRERGLEPEDPFYLIPVPVNLLDGAAAEFAAKAISQKLAEAAIEGPPALIVFDTLARSIAGGSDRDGQDMNALIETALRFQTWGATVVVVHHSGKDRTKGARGASEIEAAADTVIEVQNHAAFEKENSKAIDAGEIAKRLFFGFTKQKDDKAAATRILELPVVGLGADEEGVEITTCTVRVISSEEQAREELVDDPYLVACRKHPGPAYESTMRLVLEVCIDSVQTAENVLENLGGHSPEASPSRVFSRGTREGVVSPGMSPYEGTSGDEREALIEKRKGEKKRLYRHLKKLEDAGLIEIAGEWVTVVPIAGA